ncbi:MAG: hypothetical protein WCA44_06970 [Acidobacteriaceae bacterium]
MDLLHPWPILVLAIATGACIVILLWILFNFLREARKSKDNSASPGSTRNSRL